MKKLLTLFLVASLMLGAMPMASAELVAEGDYTDQFVNLQGDWHFKVYRKYASMFQYFDYGGCPVTWEDNDAAAVPREITYAAWETVAGPAADYSTGGLLQMFRKGTDEDVRDHLTQNELFPKWSEAWFCKTVELPAGFATEDTVTLLLGVIDDMDVVYVNGTPVGQSGFKIEAGEKALLESVPALGGFVPEGDFRFEKSYWEVSREYTFDAALLKEGKNEICVRLYNNNSFGGFYDRTMALASTRECVNYLKDLPIEKLADAADYEAVIAAQVAAIEGEDIEAYAATLASDYNENQLDKAEKVAAMKVVFDEYDNIKVNDADGGIYAYNNGTAYFTNRTVTGSKDGEQVVIATDAEYIQYLVKTDSGVAEYGNHSHCYTVTYTSELEAMGGKELMYSVYLPPSYYIETEKSYPVVYLLHGINSTGDSFVNVDKIEDHMNRLIAASEIQEMIVVMPNSGKTSWYADSEADDGVNDSQGPWASHIYVDILAQIDNGYRTLAQKEFRGISGISMGGGGVFSVGVAHTDIYTSFAAHMGAVGNAQEYVDAIPLDVLPTLNFYLDCGEQDQMVSPSDTKAIGEYLDSIGANVYWELREGAHNSAFYMAGMPGSMQMHSKHFVENGLLDVMRK